MQDAHQITISRAETKDAKILTDIAFAAKAHWQYPKYYYEIWKDELTITEDYILKNEVFIGYLNDEPIGFYSIVHNPDDFYSGEILVEKGYWLEHIFILPKFHKQGFGKQFITHLLNTSKTKNISRLLIFVDPHAKGFYEKIGANHLYDSRSSIPNRFIPVYELKIT